MKVSIKALITHALVLVFFMGAAMAYFYPVIQGKAIFQSDIRQYKGMAQERETYKATTGVESYWTNSAFGGMPTYQLGANYPHDYVKKLDRLLRFLPRPADYLFLYFLGFYVLMLCMKVDWRLAILGSLAFGFSTYYIIILGVGHNAKAHALAYLPMILGGIVLVFRKKYVLGFLLTAIAMALEISANHYQMTYYFMLLVLILGITYLIDAIRRKQLKHFFIAVGLLIGAVVLGIATNATGIMATKEYADWSTRGKSALTINSDGSEKEIQDGLDREYITYYSYGITESLNVFVPRLFGGSGQEDLGKDSKVYQYFVDQGVPPSRAIEISGLYLYWGPHPLSGPAGPAYIGAVIFFLFLISLFLVKGKAKWWLLGGILMSLLLSWGKNFPWLTNFMIDYFPLYNKFRAVSSIQVILELCVPILAVLGLKELVSGRVKKKAKLKALRSAGITGLGIIIVIFLLIGVFDFTGQNDQTYAGYFGEAALEILQSDRKSVYISDTFRSLLFMGLAALVVLLMVRGTIKKHLAIVGLGLLVVVDLLGVNQRYVNEDDFMSQRLINRPFQASEADNQIQADPSIFRVFDPAEGLNGARNSYFHKSLGGYHAAKPAKLEDLVTFHLYSNNLDVLNMLNVKYIFQEDEEGNRVPAVNPDANGPAWFVEHLIPVENANQEIKSLDSLNTKRNAVFDRNAFPELQSKNFTVDSLTTIRVMGHRPDVITYETANTQPGFAVFSEMHYPKGWVVTLDGKEVPHFRVNYALRGMEVPSGKHEIEFRFEPEVITTGSTIALASNIMLGVLLLSGLFWMYRKEGKKGDN
ncbi:MAG: YfhO family protein [Bacteroidota bacterium]